MLNKPDGNGDQNDDESFRSLLFQWLARTPALAFELVIPTLIGIVLDRFFRTLVLFTLIGVVAGMALVFWQLLKIARE